jgi:hypothetical protein
MTQMTLQDKAIGTALRMLDNLGCVYAVITPAGETLGKLKVKPQNKRQKRSDYVYGEVLQYARPILEKINPGEVQFVSFDKYDARVFCSSISSFCTRIWGKKSYTYETVEGGINLLRVL